MNRLPFRAVTAAMAILFVLPAAALARGSGETRLQSTVDLQAASSSFLAAAGACSSPAQPCTTAMPLRTSALAGVTANLAEYARSNDMKPTVRTQPAASEAPSRALLGGIGMLLLGCVARLRETRRRAFRLFDAHVH